MKRMLWLMLILAGFYTVLGAGGEGTSASREAYLRQYAEAKKYVGSRERNRDTAIARLEVLKKLDPRAPENLDVDYSIAMMWLSGGQTRSGETVDLEKFSEQVERMRETYSDRLNDIRMVRLLSTLENDVLPSLKLKAENRTTLTPEEKQAIIERLLRFLTEGRHNVVAPPDSGLSVDGLVQGALGGLKNLHTLAVLAKHKKFDIAQHRDEVLAAMDQVIELLKKDPRTVQYVPEIERDKQQWSEAAARGLHPNPPEPVEEAKQTPSVDVHPVRGTFAPWLFPVGVAGVLLAMGLWFIAKKRRRTGLLLLAAALFVGSGGALAKRWGRLDVQLRTVESSGIERHDDPVTSGVSLPRGKVKDASRLRLLDAQGRPVACQFTPQCRWPDGSLKWVLLDFQASVCASNAASYTLSSGGKGAAPSQGVKVSSVTGLSDLGIRRPGSSPEQQPLPQGLVIDTGPLQVTIVTNAPGLLHSVVLDGREIVSATNPVQVELADASNRVFRASKPTRMVVESSGPMRATVLVQGEFVSDDGSKIFDGKVGYDLRVTGYAGKSYAKVDFTLKNHGWYGYRNENKPRQWLRFKSLELRVPVTAAAVYGSPPTEPWNVRFADGWTAVASQRVWIAQRIKYSRRDERGKTDCEAPEEENQERGPLVCYKRRTCVYYRLERGTLVGCLAHGEKSEGWCDLMIGQDRLAGGAVRNFWQNAPKELKVEEGALILALWPECGFWPRTQEAHDSETYQFEGGREKTGEMLLVFGKAGPQTRRLAKAFNDPLLAEAPADWHRNTGAVWPMASAGLTAGDRELAEALGRYDRLQRAKAHAEDGDPAGNLTETVGDIWDRVSIPSLRERCPDVFYGWMNFGDLVWSHGYCSLFYDWPYQMLIQHLRFGDRAMFRLAEDMCRHRYDIDQYHVGNTAEWLGYFQRYEKGEHGNLDRQPSKTRRWENNPAPSHTWNRGLLLHWALTGDPRSLQTARENGEAYHRHFYGQHKLGEKEKLVWNEFRSPGWAIENWLALYEYTGEGKYLDWANETFTKTLLAMEQGNGSCGHILKDGKQSAQFTGYIIEPVCRLHHLTGRKDAADFLRRVLDWQREKGCAGGETKDGKYQPIVFFEDWSLAEEGDLDSGAGLSFDFLFADGYAYLYKLFGRKTDIDFARRLFRDSLFYYSFGLGAEPSARSPLGYHYFGDPLGMASKLHAYSGRYHQLFLQTEEDHGTFRKK